MEVIESEEPRHGFPHIFYYEQFSQAEVPKKEIAALVKK